MVHLRMLQQSRSSLLLTACTVACAALLAGCGSIPNSMPGLDKSVPFSPADFDNTSMYTRHVLASQSRTCEAARRALLSQGYLVNTATAELVTGRKYFQPTNDIHYQVEMRVVCATEGRNDDKTAAYASALQDRYVIKKINNSASLGVGAIGSVSLPVSATDDTLVKVGSETVSDPKFYELFFQLFDRYVPTSAEQTAPSALPVGTPSSAAPPAEYVPEVKAAQAYPIAPPRVQAYEVKPPIPAPVEIRPPKSTPDDAVAPASEADSKGEPSGMAPSSMDSVIEQLMAEHPSGASLVTPSDDAARPTQRFN